MINFLANSLIGLVALLHAYFLVLEMFFWDKPAGLKAFGLDPEFAGKSKVMAMNLGLYNGFLALGLGWGLSLGTEGHAIKVFFLACVVAAGVFGGLTAHRKILMIQALPALVAVLLLALS